MKRTAIDPELVETMKTADIAAFSCDMREFADQFVEDSGLRAAQESRRGRGAGINPVGRFETLKAQSFDDGWQGEVSASLKTSVQAEKARTIISTNTSPDISFERSINPYRGCEHGCIYCFARPTHAYMGLSAGLDFESKLFAKPDAARLLEREISKSGYKPKTIAIGTNTDPYQPIEKDWLIMREILEVLNRAHHPVAIVTKSALIMRDIDLLGAMAERRLVRVALSITTLDRRLARTMEPRASTPLRRLKAIEALAKVGVPVSVMVAPIIPGLNDHEIEQILEAARDHGATGAGFVMLRLPFEVAPLFRDWLLRECPDRYRRVMQLVRDMRGGKDYDANWKTRMRGDGPFAELVAKRFRLAAARLGLNKRSFSLDCSHFTPPISFPQQLTLF